MSAKRLLKDALAIRSFAERLDSCEAIRRFDAGENREAWTLAHSFSDLEESFRKFLDEQLPKLVQGNLKETEMIDVLLEIGEEFRHILYHIKDPQFFRYLLSEECAAATDHQ